MVYVMTSRAYMHGTYIATFIRHNLTIIQRVSPGGHGMVYGMA